MESIGFVFVKKNNLAVNRIAAKVAKIPNHKMGWPIVLCEKYPIQRPGKLIARKPKRIKGRSEDQKLRQ